MHTPRSKTSSHNTAYSGNLDYDRSKKYDSDGYIKEAGYDAPIHGYIDDNGTLEVARDCLKHYTRIPQSDVGNPDIDLSCPQDRCRKAQGFPTK